MVTRIAYQLPRSRFLFSLYHIRQHCQDYPLVDLGLATGRQEIYHSLMELDLHMVGRKALCQPQCAIGYEKVGTLTSNRFQKISLITLYSAISTYEVSPTSFPYHLNASHEVGQPQVHLE